MRLSYTFSGKFRHTETQTQKLRNPEIPRESIWIKAFESTASNQMFWYFAISLSIANVRLNVRLASNVSAFSVFESFKSFKLIQGLSLASNLLWTVPSGQSLSTSPPISGHRWMTTIVASRLDSVSFEWSHLNGITWYSHYDSLIWTSQADKRDKRLYNLINSLNRDKTSGYFRDFKVTRITFQWEWVHWIHRTTNVCIKICGRWTRWFTQWKISDLDHCLQWF